MPLAPEFVKPAHLWVPDHVTSAGGEAADFAADLGMPPDPEQRLALDTLLAEKPAAKKGEMRWAALEGAVIAPRQNIKTYLFLIIELMDLYVHGLELVTHTAHEFSTTLESFRQVKQLIEEHAWLSRRVKDITESHGEEGVELTTGQRLRFKARTLTGSRGLTGERVILDEGFALRKSHMGSLVPTLSAKSITGNPQILYGSSGGMLMSAVLRAIRDRGRAGGDPFLAYIEWMGDPGDRECATPNCDHHYGIAGCLLDDESLWAAANLALGRRISIEFLRMERMTLTPEEFAREILGWWEDPPDEDGGWDVIAHKPWNGCLDEKSRPTGVLRWSLDVSPESRSAAVSVSDGVHGEVMEYRRGTAWVVPWLVERLDRGYGDLVIDPKGPVGGLLNELEAAKVPVQPVTINEHAQACVALLAAIDGGTFRHIGQEPLDAAARTALRRTLTDVWLWTRSKSTGDICPLVSVTLARWAALTAPTGGPFMF